MNWEFTVDVPADVELTDETVDAFIQGFKSDGTAMERSSEHGTYPVNLPWDVSRYSIPESISFGTKRIPGTNPFYFVNQIEDEQTVHKFGHLEEEEDPFDPEKITLIVLDDNLEDTERIQELDSIEAAIIFAINNNYGFGSEKVRMVVGREVMETVYPAYRPSLLKTNIYRVHIKTSAMTALASSAFCNYTNLQEVILPNSITDLGENNSFSSTAIQTFTVPPLVTTLGEYCFYECRSLKEIHLPDGLINIGINSDYGAAFYYAGLESIEIPASVTYINPYSFYGCFDLLTIRIHKAEGSIEGAPWGAARASVVWD